MKTNFSIITINKNNAIGLKATIESVKKQKITKFKFEHIIIDGKSHDKSKNIIKKNKKYFSFSQSKKDDGIYNAMNIGIKKAKFDWLIFLNSGDTFCENNTLKKISAMIEKKPRLPSIRELNENISSRSAKLRYIIKKKDFYDFNTDIVKKFKALLEIENLGDKL